MTDMKAVLIFKSGMLGVVRNSQKVKRLYWLHCIGLARNTVDQFLQSSCCFVFKIGPIRPSRKFVFLDKIFVITNALQVRMVCRDVTIFG